MQALETSAIRKFESATENQLILATLRGENEAYGELVSRNHTRLYATMLRLAQSADMAEEIVQDTFVQAYMNLSKFGQRAAFSTWLFRIGFNKYMSLRRSRLVTTSLEGVQLLDTHESAEAKCVRGEIRQSVVKALERLDSKSRKILVLREMNGLSYVEIGEVLGLKPGTVRSQLSRARGKLHRELTRLRNGAEALF